MKGFITYEQAVKLNELQPVAEVYKNMVLKIIQTSQEESILQLTHADIIGRAYELSVYYYEKDYSKFLFDETQSLFDAFNEIDITNIASKWHALSNTLQEIRAAAPGGIVNIDDIQNK